MKTARFEYFEGRDGCWYWRLKAKNGKTLCHSEGYSSRAKCRAGIRAAVTAVRGYIEVRDASA